MPASGSAPTLDAAVIRQAARWLVRLHSGEAGPDDHAALERWRRADPRHELAWQRAQRLSRQFSSVPSRVGVPVLTRQAGLNRRAALKTLALLGLTLPVAWLGYRYAPLFQDADDYRTAVGEGRKVVLADGSQVQLNTATDMDVRYSDSARLLRLRRGEIYVQTASDPSAAGRPFLIETAQGRLRALGTRFVVRQLGDGESSLSVLEHRVEVTLRSGGVRRIVDAGQELLFTADSFKSLRTLPRRTGARAAETPDWTRGVLQADNMRLDVFLAELSRYRHGIIRCDPEVAALRVSGVFRLDDTDHVLAVVRETLPVRLVRHTRYWVTVAAKAA